MGTVNSKINISNEAHPAAFRYTFYVHKQNLSNCVFGLQKQKIVRIKGVLSLTSYFRKLCNVNEILELQRQTVYRNKM